MDKSNTSNEIPKRESNRQGAISARGLLRVLFSQVRRLAVFNGPRPAKKRPIQDILLHPK